MQDIHAQRVEYAKDIRDLKASVDTTRRALDPEELAKHVADNNTAFIGEHLGHLATIAKLGHNTANETKAALANLKDTTQNIATTQQQLAAVANRLEARDAR
ncbi:hypothetical protein FEV53_18935 [Palleronia caenipelagi]|uniref:Uncharacterized protein n=2 Tax=Palleronia caenipelagi TaxID=2489174 RepID=A0A547PK94_9RHOB|nr:hypothetical protein FEV53_18935 [Palleronia caenipelagi]